MNYSVHMVDVFGGEPLSGNPVAVIAGADEMTTEQMQQLTRWFNLSETTFLLPATEAGADYRVRIFTLEREMPFAGHPTLGTCHAWLESGHVPRNRDEIVQQCGAGLVKIRRDQGRLSFAAPPLIRSGPVAADDLGEALRFLGVEADDVVDAAWVDNGPGWLGIKLASAEQVLALDPIRSWPKRIDVGVVGPWEAGAEAAFEVRAFFSDHANMILEDPVTGSLNASLAQWLFETGAIDGAYIAAQGTRLGRAGRVHVSRDDTGQVWIGGRTRTQVDGRLLGV